MASLPASLADLKNLGPVSCRWLEEAGIATPGELRRVGAVMAYQIVRHRRPEANALLLYALHGALTDTHWSSLSPAVRARLRAEAAVPLQVRPGTASGD